MIYSESLIEKKSFCNKIKNSIKEKTDKIKNLTCVYQEPSLREQKWNSQSGRKYLQYV